jgi:hypothetical protein
MRSPFDRSANVAASRDGRHPHAYRTKRLAGYGKRAVLSKGPVGSLGA